MDVQVAKLTFSTVWSWLDLMTLIFKPEPDMIKMYHHKMKFYAEQFTGYSLNRRSVRHTDTAKTLPTCMHGSKDTTAVMIFYLLVWNRCLSLVRIPQYTCILPILLNTLVFWFQSVRYPGPKIPDVSTNMSFGNLLHINNCLYQPNRWNLCLFSSNWSLLHCGFRVQ